MMILLGIALWWLIGFASFVYWWTRELDLTLGGLPFAAAIGLMGPAAFVLGFGIHGSGAGASTVLIRKRRP